MSRVYSSSKRPVIQSERMDSWEHEERSSFGGGSYHHQERYGIEIMIRSLLNDGTCSWVMIVNGINQYVTDMTTSITLEQVQGNLLLKQDRNKHQHQRLLQRLRYHTTSVIGSTWSQVVRQELFRSVKKRCSDCFDTILQYFEKKTEQSNSESRCFVQNLRLLSIGQFEHG